MAELWIDDVRLWATRSAILSVSEHIMNITGMSAIRTVHLARHRFLPKDGSGTVFCVMTYRGEPGPALAFLSPGQFPEFEGEAAWFRVRWFSKRRREFLEQIDAPT